MLFQILVLDDEILVCNSMKRILEDREKKVLIATTVEQAREILQNTTIDLILLDYKLVDTDGLSVLKEMRENYPETLVVMITAYGNIDIAVEAMKIGAYDFIQKKEEPPFIRFVVQRALDNLRLKKEVEELREAYRQETCARDMVSVSPAMRHVTELAREYAKSDTTVLITGETGTGKNLLARYIHYSSSRFNKPFVTINCTAIPHELIESELFGYEKGAFTGARQKGKMGLIERAHGGTLFLDEIGELPLDLQSKLLHVVEEGEFFRVGAVEPTKVDNRIIAATNCNLQERVQENKFRLDLYYRLNIAELHIPPLRERPEDIIPLAKHFIEELNEKLNKSITKIEPEAEEFLLSSPWNGNIRELRNYIERAMLLKTDSVLRLQDFIGTVPVPGGNNARADNSMFNIHLNPCQGTNLLQQAQKLIISRALEISGNNRSKAARLLGIPRTSLNFYIQKMESNE